MTLSQSQWQTRELAQTFLEGVRGAIPGADFQIEVLRKIVGIWCPAVSRILDLGCGDGILGRALLEDHPAAQAIFVDFSDPMLEALRRRVGDRSGVTIVRADFSTPAWTAEISNHGPIEVVVSGFSIHHQPDDRKREIFAEIYPLLADGGVFLNLEHVSSPTPSVERLHDSYFVDHLLKFHRGPSSEKTRQEVEETYYQRADKKENILAPVEAQCQWLRQIGFQDVDCFFKVFELALFGGRKTAHAERSIGKII